MGLIVYAFVESILILVGAVLRGSTVVQINVRRGEYSLGLMQERPQFPSQRHRFLLALQSLSSSQG